MIGVVQRIIEAEVTSTAPPHRAAAGPGLCVLLAVEAGDADQDATWMADKLARLRIFRDENDRMNRSVLDTGGEILLVSQFTLAGDCTRGNRPSFVRAADPTEGERLYLAVADRLRSEHRLTVGLGVFGADMRVRLVNDGPVTLIVQRR